MGHIKRNLTLKHCNEPWGVQQVQLLKSDQTEISAYLKFGLLETHLSWLRNARITVRYQHVMKSVPLPL